MKKCRVASVTDYNNLKAGPTQRLWDRAESKYPKQRAQSRSQEEMYIEKSPCYFWRFFVFFNPIEFVYDNETFIQSFQNQF